MTCDIPTASPLGGKTRRSSASVTSRTFLRAAKGSSPLVAFLARGAVAMLLLLSAFLKTRQMATSGSEIGLIEGPVLIAGLVCLAFWLVSGFATGTGLRVTSVLFVGFAAWAGLQGMQGSNDCGCFGSLAVSPWQTAIADLLIAAGCWLLASVRSFGLNARMIGAVACLVGCGVFVHALSASALRSPHGTSSDLAWIDDIETDVDLRAGQWEVVVVRHACDKCFVFLDALEYPDAGTSRILVEMEPYAGDASDLIRRANAGAYGRLPISSRLAIDAAPLSIRLIAEHRLPGRSPTSPPG